MFIGVNDQHSLNLCQKQHHFVVYWLMVFVASCPCLFFLEHSDKDLHVWDSFHMCCYQVAVPLMQQEHIQNMVVALCPTAVLLLHRKFLSRKLSSHFCACSALWCSCSPEQKMALHWGHPFIQLCWMRRASFLSHDHWQQVFRGFLFCHRFLWSLCQAMLPLLPWWNFTAQPQVCSQTQGTH